MTARSVPDHPPSGRARSLRARSLRSALLDSAAAHDVAGDSASAAVVAAAAVHLQRASDGVDPALALHLAADLEAGGSPEMAAILRRVAGEYGVVDEAHGQLSQR